MGLYLQTNTTSLFAQNALGTISNNLSKSLERLSTGYRINNASDDAGGLLAAENYDSQIRGLQAATRNVQQGQSMVNTADGAMQSIYNDLQQMRELAVEAANGTVTNYAPYNAQLNDLMSNIDQVATGTVFNGKVLLDGSVGANFNLQVGANGTAADTINIASAFSNNKSAGLGLAAAAINSQATAQTFITSIDTASATLSSNVAKVGEFEDQLNNQLNTLSVSIQNYSSAEASIRDTDVASEASNVVKLQVAQQASAAALAQANLMPSIANQLLQNL